MGHASEGDGSAPLDGQNRRTFLKCAGTAVAGLGLAECAGVAAQNAADRVESSRRDIGVRVERPADPLVARAFAILKDRIQQRCSARVIEVGSEARVILTVDSGLPGEAFRIEQAGAAVRVAGGSPRGLLYGVGKFLRTSRYDGSFQPSPWRGVSKPHGSLRGMYFATHFHNWYHQASPAEVTRYMEDLALWGVNAFKVILPMINLQGWDDPQAEPAMAMVRQYAKTARSLGIQFATGVNNTMFRRRDLPTRIAQCAPKNHKTTTTAAQSHRNAVKQNAGVSEPLRLRRLSR